MKTPLLVVGIAALALPLTLAACASTDAGGPPPLTPLSRFSLQLEPGLDRIALAVHDDGLSGAQQSALYDLARRYQTSGSGAVRVEAPSGDDPAAGAQAYAVRGALQAAGVPAERIVIAAYAAPDPRAPVLAGFETLHAVIPDCAARVGDLSGGRFGNQSSSNLGCAITANMAAQIADPRDIAGPRSMTPSDSARAAVVFDNYRKGQPTSSPQEQLVAGRVARAVD